MLLLLIYAFNILLSQITTNIFSRDIFSDWVFTGVHNSTNINYWDSVRPLGCDVEQSCWAGSSNFTNGKLGPNSRSAVRLREHGRKPVRYQLLLPHSAPYHLDIWFNAQCLVTGNMGANHLVRSDNSINFHGADNFPINFMLCKCVTHCA